MGGDDLVLHNEDSCIMLVSLEAVLWFHGLGQGSSETIWIHDASETPKKSFRNSMDPTFLENRRVGSDFYASEVGDLPL